MIDGLKDKRIVITGATGMIGVSMTRQALMSGAEVYAVIRPASKNAGRLDELKDKYDGFHLVECELDSLEELPGHIKNSNNVKQRKKCQGNPETGKCEGTDGLNQETDVANKELCDIFYHLGWANTGKNRNVSPEAQNINVEYTVNAVDAAAALGCKHFVGAGSQAEYGPKDIEKIGPETSCEPTEFYGVAKLAAKEAAAKEAAAKGIGFSWARIFSTYGPNDKLTTMISENIARMIRGEPTEYTAATQMWDYLYVDDMARAFLLVGTNGKDGKVYCLGSGEGRPLREYIEIMTKAVDPSIEPGIGKKPYPPGKVRNLCADISSLTMDTGFLPNVPFEEGIRYTIEDMKKRVVK